jgi:hypothetical protein
VAGSANHSASGQHQRHVVGVTATSISASSAFEMVHTTTATRPVRNPFAASALGQGGTGFVVGQASPANVIPSTASGRHNTAATSHGTFIPLQSQKASAEESVSLIVQLGTTVVATSAPQMLTTNSTVTVSKPSPTSSLSARKNVSLNYPQGINQLTGASEMQQHTQHTHVIQRPTADMVANRDVKNSIDFTIEHLYGQQQVVQPQEPVALKQSQTLAKTPGNIRASTDEQG